MHVKVGDTVQVVSGRERGKTGKVLRVDQRRGRVFVEGLNMVKRHRRPGVGGAEGGIVEKEASIHSSNVLLFSEKANRGVRTSYRFVGAGGEFHLSQAAATSSFPSAPARIEKIRFCAKTGEVFR